MKWYDFITIFGLVMLGLGIQEVFSLESYKAWYYDYYHDIYIVAPYENQYLFNLLFTGVVLTVVGIGINVGIPFLKRYLESKHIYPETRKNNEIQK